MSFRKSSIAAMRLERQTCRGFTARSAFVPPRQSLIGLEWGNVQSTSPE